MTKEISDLIKKRYYIKNKRDVQIQYCKLFDYIRGQKRKCKKHHRFFCDCYIKIYNPQIEEYLTNLNLAYKLEIV
jgi:hypothetical protein